MIIQSCFKENTNLESSFADDVYGAQWEHLVAKLCQFIRAANEHPGLGGLVFDADRSAAVLLRAASTADDGRKRHHAAPLVFGGAAPHFVFTVALEAARIGQQAKLQGAQRWPCHHHRDQLARYVCYFLWNGTYFCSKKRLSWLALRITKLAYLFEICNFMQPARHSSSASCILITLVGA